MPYRYIELSQLTGKFQILYNSLQFNFERSVMYS